MKALHGLVMLLVLLFAMEVAAQGGGVPMPRPNASTPTLKGAQVMPPGSFAIGATTGYPSTAFNMYFGISRVFDLGVTTGITYCGKVCGLRQDVGLDVHVPLRWTLFHSGIVAGGLRFAPYFMIGQGSPSVSIGGDFAFLIDIAVPKIFKVIIGPELRTGFASTGNGNNRSNFYDGAMVLNFGLETVLARQWFLGLMFRAGGNWAAGDRSGGGGIFNALIYFAYKF